MGREDREVIGGLATYGIPATTTHKVNLGKKGKSLKPLHTMSQIAFENKLHRTHISRKFSNIELIVLARDDKKQML